MNENKNNVEYIEIEDKDYKKEEVLREEKKKVKKGFKKYKRILFSIISLIVVSGAVMGGIVLKTVKDSEKYTLDQAKTIALEQVKGTVIKSEREIEDLHVEYEFKIKDEENMIQEVTVDGETGAILEINSPSIRHHKK